MRDYIRNGVMCVESTLTSLHFLINPKKVAGKRLRIFIKELNNYFFENEVEKLREFDLEYWNEKLSAIEYYNSEVRGKGQWALIHSMNLVATQLEILYELHVLQKNLKEK